MGDHLPDRLPWLEHALQGLAFWMGHRLSLFHEYPLPEGALVAEACNLIQANLPGELVLMPECMYKNLVPPRAPAQNPPSLARADLVICTERAKLIGRDGNLASVARYVMEVKRGKATRQLINEDLTRLYGLLEASHPRTRCFLILVCEGFAPERFVSDGKSILRPQPIRNCQGHFKVRRSLKAAASFSGKKSAHYVCLIEVLRQA